MEFWYIYSNDCISVNALRCIEKEIIMSNTIRIIGIVIAIMIIVYSINELLNACLMDSLACLLSIIVAELLILICKK